MFCWKTLILQNVQVHWRLNTFCCVVLNAKNWRLLWFVKSLTRFSISTIFRRSNLKMVASPDFTLLCLHVETFRVSDSPEVSLTQVDFSKVLSDPGIPELRVDLTDVTLADEDTNPILKFDIDHVFRLGFQQPWTCPELTRRNSFFLLSPREQKVWILLDIYMMMIYGAS